MQMWDQTKSAGVWSLCGFVITQWKNHKAWWKLDRKEVKTEKMKTDRKLKP